MVGEDKVSFHVHKATICQKSVFFDTACNSEHWREAKDKVVPLPLVEPALFKAYVHWLYTGKLLPEVH